MGRKFGLFRSYKLGVANVLSMLTGFHFEGVVGQRVSEVSMLDLSCPPPLLSLTVLKS